MSSVYSVAQSIIGQYKRITGTDVQATKLQKLLYLVQRESMAVLGHPAFAEDMQGWIHGPVNLGVWTHFQNGTLDISDEPVDDDLLIIVQNIIYGYGLKSAQELTQLSHQEVSWRKSREGLQPDDVGNVVLSLNDIRVDAYAYRPYDYIWGMYYDEVEDDE